MTDMRKITGLTEYGSTRQTIALSHELYRNKEARDALRKMLDDMETPIRYSNEDFDKKQRCAATLADIMRNGSYEFTY